MNNSDILSLINATKRSLSDYENVLDLILELTMGAESFSLDGKFENNEIEKCELFLEMLDVLQDVPLSRADWILNERWKSPDHLRRVQRCAEI